MFPRRLPPCRKVLPGALLLLVLAAGGCERTQPATRAGEALDHAGSQTGKALDNAARETGGALERAGTWVRDRTN